MNLKLTKRIAAIGLAAMMSGCMLANPSTIEVLTDTLSITASAATASGTCGTNLRWSLSGDTLTITGSGTQMTDYNQTTNKAPWNAYATQVKKVILPKTLKRIGNYAFWKMSALEYLYTANGNGYNQPTFPDVTYIGRYAFADCYKFRGNTENGKLTLGMGTSSVMQGGSIRVCDSAFQNCDQVRFLYVNYASMYVEGWGFYDMNMLSSVQASNTTLELMTRAFYRSSALATVNFKPSVEPIHKEAFTGTSYYNNKCTNTDYSSRNFGAATKLNGKTLVVNFFVDRTRVNLNTSSSQYDDYCGFVRQVDYRKSQGLTYGSDELATGMPVRNDSNTSYMGIFKKDKMTCTYDYAWNPQKVSNQNNPGANAVRTLNNLNFTAQPNKKKIPVNTVKNGVTSGYFGSYVSSTAITNRLNDVRAAMDDLKTQASAYGSSFTYEMHPETNFQITYDTFDWATERASFQGHDLGYSYVKGYPGTNGTISVGNAYGKGTTYITDDPDNILHKKIAQQTQKLTGQYAQPIDMKLYTGNAVSNYTYYLKNTYNVQNVIYLFHVNTESQSFAEPTVRVADQANFNIFNRMDEFAVICSKTGNNSGSILAEHEIAHLFGAKDYYSLSSSSAAGQYVNNYFSGKGELMTCTGKNVSPVTAFSVGWTDKLDTVTYNKFFG